MATTTLRALTASALPDNTDGDVTPEALRGVIIEAANAIDAAGVGIDGTAEVTSSGATVVNIPHTYLTGTVKVYRNGVRLPAAAFTESAATTITLGSAPDAGDIISIDFKY